MIIPSRRRSLVLAATAAAAAGGSLVALRVRALDLTLSHYDARGHLIVARRIFDSLTPGWQQVGAVWLPLPHLLNALPVQVDAWYRTGASAVAFSVASFAIATGAIAWIIATVTGSSLAALAGALVFALNPNVLYLQATPMTEPLLLGLTAMAVASLVEWTRGEGLPARQAGWAFALACLTRYEAWPVTASALVASAWALWRTGHRPLDALTRVGAIARYPALAIAGFAIFSRVVIGQWMVADRFYVPENAALGHPWIALSQVAWGVRQLTGPALLAAGTLGAAALGLTAFAKRDRAFAAIPLALTATAVLPWIAFAHGHPYRIRYLVPLVAAEAVLAGVAAGLVKRAGRFAPLALVLIVAVELRPMSVNAPMIVEAQWDRPNIARRQPVTDYLRSHYGGETIMTSMGSLGHYMQDLSRSGFAVSDFLHEGNGDVWLNALDDPRPYVGWILIEEQAEGGDMLADIARKNPKFLGGFSRIREGAGLALYRRNPVREPPPQFP
jgi:hypothetical protein